MFRRLTPMLRTPDLPGTLAFYRDVLGFELASGAPEHGWLALRRDGADLMLSGLNAHEGDAATGFTGSLYLEVRRRRCAVGRRCATMRASATTPETFAYGMREFAVYDNNGYLAVSFGTPVCDDA
jgi:Glyoxalase/Bleomycin resistance protein/Dioxygenase superfamily.